MRVMSPRVLRGRKAQSFVFFFILQEANILPINEC